MSGGPAIPNYIHFNYNTKDLGGTSLRLFPLACMHVGAAQCDMKFIKEQIARIKHNSAARWIYLGDGGECVTTMSKGDVYGQLLSPGKQQDLLVELLSPIKNKGLFGIIGNHGARIYKATGLDFDHTLCARLGIPFWALLLWRILL